MAAQSPVAPAPLRGQGAATNPDEGPMHHRRSLFALPLLAALLPAAAARAQTQDMAPPADGMGRADRPRADRKKDKPKLYDLDYDAMSPRQRKRLQQALAGEGGTPLSAEEARQRWGAMDTRQRRDAIRKGRGDQGRQADRSRGDRGTSMQ